MNWITELDKVTKAVDVLFSHLTSEQLNFKPTPNAWSIAQNLEHLIVVNETYYPVLTLLKSGTYKTPFMAKFGFMVSFFGKTVLNGVQPDRSKKMKTFPVWEPSKSEVKSDILLRFKNHQEALKQRIKEVDDLVKKGTVISSPANKIIVYKLETAFDIIVTHEQLHLEQAKEILNLLKK